MSGIRDILTKSLGSNNPVNVVRATIEALKSPNLKIDPGFKTFIDIAQHPKSNTTPANVDGGAYQVTFQDFGYQYESGKASDLKAGLEKTAKQIDTDIAKQK